MRLLHCSPYPAVSRPTLSSTKLAVSSSPKQRIGLLGRNGAGKSTFLKLLSGQVEPDHGSVIQSPGARIAELPQTVPAELQGDVFSVVKQGVVAAPGQILECWEVEHLTESILSKMQLEPTQRIESMSAGWKRRVLLARALVQSPDLLLLDEPTNHLDVDSIRWLEDFLDRYDRGFIFITHDRRFLRRLANRILELEGGQLFDWSCDYDTFLSRKAADLAAQEKQEKLFDKKLAQEEAWIRQGIKARRTRNEGRVRALKELRMQRSMRREKQGTSNLQIQEGCEAVIWCCGQRNCISSTRTVMRCQRAASIPTKRRAASAMRRMPPENVKVNRTNC